MDGFLNGSRYLLMDRDTKYSEAFCQILKQENIKSVRLPPKSRNLNGYVAYCTSLVRLGRISGNRRRSDSFWPLGFYGSGVIEWIEQTLLLVIVWVSTQQSMMAPDLDHVHRHLKLFCNLGER